MIFTNVHGDNRFRLLQTNHEILTTLSKLTTLSRLFQDSEEPWRGNQHPNWLTRMSIFSAFLCSHFTVG